MNVIHLGCGLIFVFALVCHLLHPTFQLQGTRLSPVPISLQRVTDAPEANGRVHVPSGHAFNIIEHKTGKVRRFKVQEQVYNFLLEYADSEGIEGDDLIFPIGVRAVQKHLKKVCDWLGPGYEDISTHSFRKYFGTEIYYKNGKDIELVRRLYQHSSAAVTARYLGVTDEKIEQALDSHVDIIYRPK